MIIPSLRTGTDLITISYMRTLDDDDLASLRNALRQKLSDVESIQSDRRSLLRPRLYAAPPVASVTRLRLVPSLEEGEE